MPWIWELGVERRSRITQAGALAGLTLLVVCAQLAAAEQPKRARPPKWTTADLDAFFPDARTKLVGSRPDYGRAAAAAASTTPARVTDAANAKPAADGAWSQLIDADTLEVEIKRLGQQVGKSATSPAPFKGGGYKDCRRDFSELAALFAVTADYDGDARWKDTAAALRDAFARAGHNCKVGTDQSFQEAKQRKQDLADLVAGSRPNVAVNTESKVDWPQIADRPPLMQRLNIAQQDRLAKWLANKQEFTARRDDIKIESQLVATVGDIIGRTGYEFWDDETYAKLARELKQGGVELAAAVDINNFDQARQALARTTKACADCHEGFRQ